VEGVVKIFDRFSLPHLAFRSRACNDIIEVSHSSCSFLLFLGEFCKRRSPKCSITSKFAACGLRVN
jgi:hypothetical protein